MPLEASIERSPTNGNALIVGANEHVSTWRKIDAALSPIIGKNGVAELVRRTVDLSRSRYPWLHMAHGDAIPDGWIAALATALSKQPREEATAANDEILKAFGDLLAKLIGQSLAGRLLQSTWSKSSRTKTSQETWTQ